MKASNRQLLSSASRKATSVVDFIHRLPSDFVINDYYFLIAKARESLRIKAILKNINRADDLMTVIEYQYPRLVLRYNKNPAVLINN